MRQCCPLRGGIRRNWQQSLNLRYTNYILKLDTSLLAYYTFDNGDASDLSGNGYNGIIHGKPTFTLTAPSGATNTVNYTYGDANWKDKLTNFNGKAITYDAIGNPLTYDGYSYSWEWGRQLASMTGNGNTISYKYNDSGIRTQKTVNDITTNYHLVGDKVTYEDNGTDKVKLDSGGGNPHLNLS